VYEYARQDITYQDDRARKTKHKGLALTTTLTCHDLRMAFETWPCKQATKIENSS
jgi:hypothetical protein